MKHIFPTLTASAVAALFFLSPWLAAAQQSLTWDQVKAKFEAANPALKADALNVDEMRAEEITAFLRPNPQFTLLTDGTQLRRTTESGSRSRALKSKRFSYLHERDHKRELRLESAKEGTHIASRSTRT